MDPLETVALVRQKRGMSQLPNPMFIDGGSIPVDPPAPEMSPEEAAIMKQFEYDDEHEGSDDAGAPGLEPAGHVSPPSPLIPPQYRGAGTLANPPALPAETPPLELCVLNNVGSVFDQGTELTPDDIAAIKLVVLRRCSTRLQEQIEQVERPKASHGTLSGVAASDGHREEVQAAPPARKRGRPKGSKNKPKEVANEVGHAAEAERPGVPDAPAGEVSS